MIAKIGKRIPGTEGLNNSSAKGSTFNNGRKLFEDAKAKTTIVPSRKIENNAKFTEKRRNMFLPSVLQKAYNIIS